MIENNKYKLSVENRLTRVETTLGEVVNNHLPHLQEGIETIDNRMRKLEYKLAFYGGGIGALIMLKDIIIKFINSQ